MTSEAKAYDYIIVGAGSAGSVIASRLTEDANVSVLLLEAGGPDRNLLMRLGIGFYRGTPKHYSWQYQTEPEPHLGGRRVDLPQGKVLGGSSTINGKIYSRGHARDYDQWRQMGCEGWSYADVLPYFKRSERNWRGGNEFHGGSGPLDVSPIDTRPLIYEPVIAAAKARGYPLSDDLNGANGEGFCGSDNTVRKGRRASTARAFLYPAKTRPNLTIALNALTARIVVERGRAVAIDYIQDGTRRAALASREIILSAGTYNTPRLLLLSGIGPADEIRPHGITPIHDLPGVGKNISEHTSYYNEYATRGPISLLKDLRFDRATRSFLQWALLGTGLFASQGSSAQALLRTRPELDRPDVQIYFNPVRLDANIWLPGFGTRLEHRVNAIMILLHPESRGFVTLRSSNPAEPPRITLNLLAQRNDVDTLIRALRLVREIYATPPLADLIAHEVNPGPDARTDAQIEDYMRRTAGTSRHPVGSCRMGHDAMAVVDPQLRVRGIEGLRIADASIMPTVPGGNTNAPTIMIGEKAADLVRAG